MIAIAASIALGFLTAKTQIECELSCYPNPTVVNAWFDFYEARIAWVKHQDNGPAAIDDCGNRCFWDMLKDAQDTKASLSNRLYRFRFLKSFVSNPAKMPLPNSEAYEEGAPSPFELKQLHQILHPEEPERPSLPLPA
jgi:hypothetical protein